MRALIRASKYVAFQGRDNELKINRGAARAPIPDATLLNSQRKTHTAEGIGATIIPPCAVPKGAVIWWASWEISRDITQKLRDGKTRRKAPLLVRRENNELSPARLGVRAYPRAYPQAGVS